MSIENQVAVCLIEETRPRTRNDSLARVEYLTREHRVTRGRRTGGWQRRQTVGGPNHIGGRYERSRLTAASDRK
jgi:hypothetical protein